MIKIKQQLRRLYAVTAISSLQIAGASWVALLAARGFSLAEIGFAEAVFHLTSFLFEVPSGVIADVFGRRRSMVASQCMFAAASAAMLLSRSMAGVYFAMVLSALVGALVLLIADILARSLYAAELPLSILTTVIGVPVLLWFMCKRKGEIA